MSARRGSPDPALFHRLTSLSGALHAEGLRARGGPYEVLGDALDQWLRLARVAYAAHDFETAREDLQNARAIYGEITARMAVRNFGPWSD